MKNTAGGACVPASGTGGQVLTPSTRPRIWNWLVPRVSVPLTAFTSTNTLWGNFAQVMKAGWSSTCSGITDAGRPPLVAFCAWRRGEGISSCHLGSHPIVLSTHVSKATPQVRLNVIPLWLLLPLTLLLMQMLRSVPVSSPTHFGWG